MIEIFIFCVYHNDRLHSDSVDMDEGGNHVTCRNCGMTRDGERAIEIGRHWDATIMDGKLIRD